MKQKREKREISYEEYIEWELTIILDTIKLQIIGKNKANSYVSDYIKKFS